MDTLPMFPSENFEVGSTHLPDEETDGAAEAVSQDDRIDGHSSVQGEPPVESSETPAESEPGSSAAEETAVRAGEQAEGGEVASIYESTGLEGPFEWDPVVLIFPDVPQEGFDALVADIAANGLREEITVAGSPPKVIDGKHRERACLKAGVKPRYRLLRRDIDPRPYVWSENGERRDLDKSRKALAFAELFPDWTPGRPPKQGGNCSILNSFPGATQGEVAKAKGFSRTLFSGAVKLVNSGRPELIEAAREGVVTLSDALSKEVIGAPREVHQQALALVRDGTERTAAAAVARVLEEHPEQEDEQIPETGPPTSFGEHGAFHACSVAELGNRLEPATVDLIVACPPADARLAIFSDLGALASRVLTETGVMVVALVDKERLPEVLSRLPRKEPEWIIELSLLFPSPIGNSGEPHWIGRRWVALLVCGRPKARLTVSEDVIEVPAPGIDGDGGPPELEDGVALLVERFSSHGQVVCDPMLRGKSGVVSAALDLDCTFVGADDDQSRIDLVLEQLTGSVTEVEGQEGSVQ